MAMDRRGRGDHLAHSSWGGTQLAFPFCHRAPATPARRTPRGAVMAEVQERDPKKGGPQPPFSKQQQEHPGSEEAMRPRPDYGEQSYRGSGRLSGKAALITGGDSGIGRAVALAFAREGADVMISYLNEE